MELADSSSKNTLKANTITDACVGVRIGTGVTGTSLKQNLFVDNNVDIDAASSYLSVGNYVDGIGAHLCNDAPEIVTGAGLTGGAKRSAGGVSFKLVAEATREHLE